MASSSLIHTITSAKTLIKTSTRPKTLTSVSLSLPSSLTRSLSLSALFPRRGGFSSSVLVPNAFSVSSEYEQGQEEAEEEGGGFGGNGQASISPDLKLFVGNLPFSVDSASLAGLFERAGTVEMVEVIYDKMTGRSRGFGFVTMSSVEEAQAAEQQLNGYELDGRALRVNAGPPPPRDDTSRGFRSGGSSGSFDASNRLYVGNLSWGVDDLALQTFFGEQGKVLEAKVVYDRESGRSRGFGFVTYSSAEEVNNAISSLNGADLDGRSIRVSVAESRPRRQF
ncbi:hypothetical protein QJS04_geneDACA015323 [Acorus gramineus]|uniref:RRM domain-containing protein n=1 Tax=Acorus gramineus TaxID=55184 RepID=A0AAV9AQF5_ACOGR|nr:hypothetical protein QJS04_geneDACA015323 [Acorus gramineus]